MVLIGSLAMNGMLLVLEWGATLVLTMILALIARVIILIHLKISILSFSFFCVVLFCLFRALCWGWLAKAVDLSVDGNRNSARFAGVTLKV